MNSSSTSTTFSARRESPSSAPNNSPVDIQSWSPLSVIYYSYTIAQSGHSRGSEQKDPVKPIIIVSGRPEVDFFSACSCSFFVQSQLSTKLIHPNWKLLHPNRPNFDAKTSATAGFPSPSLRGKWGRGSENIFILQRHTFRKQMMNEWRNSFLFFPHTAPMIERASFFSPRVFRKGWK